MVGADQSLDDRRRRSMSTAVYAEKSPESEQLLLPKDRIASDTCTYTLLKSGPDVNPQDIEIPNSIAIEVMVLWGNNVLHISHVIAQNGFTVGETGGKLDACDFAPEEILGAPRLTLIVAGAQSPTIIVPARAQGSFEAPGQPRIKLQDARRYAAPSSGMSGDFELQLSARAKVSIQLAFHVPNDRCERRSALQEGSSGGR